MEKNQIFISHSKKDTNIRNSFETIFKQTEVKAIFWEHEPKFKPDYRAIKDEILDSKAVFLLLGSNINGTNYTKNWIAFEVGVACALKKKVWVFEQIGTKIEFPLPYLTDYMMYNLAESGHYNYVKSVIEAYGNNTSNSFSEPKEDERELVRCPHCGFAYILHLNFGHRYCPSCREPNWKQSPRKK